MSYINVSGEGEFASLTITLKGLTTGPIEVPALQDLSVSNANGVYRFKLLNSTSESAVLTPATNQVTTTVILDQTAFFGDGTSTGAAAEGLFNLSNDKVAIDFVIDMGGASGKTISGTGFLAGLAMTVTPDQPLWSSPLTIEVSGNYTLA